MHRHRTKWCACLLCGLLVTGSAAQLMAADKKKGPSPEEIDKIKAAIPEKATVKPARPRKLLIFNLTQGFRHGAIPYGSKAKELMGEKTGAYTSVVSEDMAMFEPDTLKQFDAVVFNNTVSLKFEDPTHRQALIDFVNGGGGMAGFHGGADNFKNWPEGAAMMGAVFSGHPWGRCPVRLDDPDHPLLRVFDGNGFWISDEIYKFKEPYSRDKLRVLLSMDPDKGDPNNKGREDRDNPVAWIQKVGEGRVFYSSLGHRHDIWWNPTILAFYLDGLQYALGDLKADATPSGQLKSQPKPALPPEKP